MKMVKYFLATAAVAALTGCLGDGNEPLAVAAAPAPTGPIQLQILSINDFEGRLEPVIVDGRPAGGAAVLASYLNEWERRATARGATTIRVQAGDAIGPTPPISGLLQDEPTMMVMDSLRIAFGTVGNHEFNEGVTELLRMQNGGRHPVTEPILGVFQAPRLHRFLAANVVWRDGRGPGGATGPIFAPYAIQDLGGGVRVGIIGITKNDVPTVVSAAGIRDIMFLDEVETVNRIANDLQSRGVRTIIVLHHRGDASGDLFGSPLTGTLVPVIERMSPHIDVIINADSHRGYWGRVGNRLVLQAFAHSSAFGAINLSIDRQTGDVISSQAEVVRTLHDPAFPPVPAVAAEVARFAAVVAPIVNTPVGTTTAPIVRDRNPAGEAPLGNLIADAQRSAMGTQIAFMNGGGIRADIPAGTVTRGHLLTVQPFGNTLIRMDMTPAQIRRLLEQQWVDQPFPRILHVSGMSYTWNPALPVGSRVLANTIMVGGVPLDTACNPTCSVAANSFIAAGGDMFSVFAEPTARTGGVADADALFNHIQRLPQPFTAAIEGRIRNP